MTSWADPEREEELFTEGWELEQMEARLRQVRDRVPVSPEAEARWKEYIGRLERGVQRLRDAVEEVPR